MIVSQEQHGHETAQVIVVVMAWRDRHEAAFSR
jgi:hypothetical protein